MSDAALKELARGAGLCVDWTDAGGSPHEVQAVTLRTVLDALGFPAETPKDIAESQRRLASDAENIPPLIVAHEGAITRVGRAKRAKLQSNEGRQHDVRLEPFKGGGVSLRAPNAPGYYELEIDGTRHVLAVAPSRCFGVADATPGRRLAALSVQIYSLQSGHSSGFGDFAALGEFAQKIGELGVDALGVSPTHAGFAADTGNIQPYAPSSRFFLDPLYADPVLAGCAGEHRVRTGELIDWPQARQRKFSQLRAGYEKFCSEAGDHEPFRDFCLKGGQRLAEHACFEALDARFRKSGIQSWQDWPAALQNSRSCEVHEFAERKKNEVDYYLFLQWLAAESAAGSQARAKRAMAIGLISDMAIGVHRHGSHAWSAAPELLGKLSIGAPPDVFNLAGQDWGLTTFSPAGLRGCGYGGFIATLRASMQYAGGIRIDHAMGLQRLWVIPQGGSPQDGVYLTYPLDDLLRLIALESRLHRAIVIGEDLGTVPEGFRARLSAAGIFGMRVLWFERDKTERFIPPQQWEEGAVALTTTHDLPTVAGWWKGCDIDWHAKLEHKPRLGSVAAEQRQRRKDRALLWAAFTESHSVEGAEPAQDNSAVVVDGAFAHLGKSSCQLAMAAAEDVFGLADQPNIPGTIDEHPNWRRRLPPEEIWRDPKLSGRLSKLTARRQR